MILRINKREKVKIIYIIFKLRESFSAKKNLLLKKVLFITKTGSGEEVLRTSFSFCWGLLYGTLYYYMFFQINNKLLENITFSLLLQELFSFMGPNLCKRNI
jgi:hypothetical protein